MTKHLARIGRYTILTLLTLLASGVMWWVSRKSNEDDAFAAGGRSCRPRSPRSRGRS